MGRLTTALAILAALAPRAHAAGDPAPAAAGPPPAAPDAAASPSRFRFADVDAFIKDRAAAFDIAGRPTDPFGLFQDPAAAPPPPKLASTVAGKFVHIPPVPFADVVGALEVTAVMPLQQRFLVGSRMIKLGDRFPIHYRDKSITVQVTKVSGRRIDFRNLKTGESAALALEVLPPGMRRDGRAAPGPPGLARDNPSAPIEVDVATPSSDVSKR